MPPPPASHSPPGSHSPRGSHSPQAFHSPPVWNVRDRPVCADRIEQSAEGTKAVPDGIILDDL